MFPQALRTRCFFRSFSHRRATFCLVRPPPRMVKYRAYRKNRTRPRRESFSLPGLIGEEPFLANELFGLFGSHLFDDRVMRERLPLSVYESLREIRDEGKPWNPEVADIVADAMQAWAMEQGATHYIHWFSPMTGTGSGKHDSFIDGVKQGEPILNFSGKMLAKGESDASSFPPAGCAPHSRRADTPRGTPPPPLLCWAPRCTFPRRSAPTVGCTDTVSVSPSARSTRRACLLSACMLRSTGVFWSSASPV